MDEKKSQRLYLHLIDYLNKYIVINYIYIDRATNSVYVVAI